MKKIGNTLLLVFLVCVLAGLCSYTVFAALNANLNFSNRIYFTTNGDLINFKAEITILEKGYDPDDPEQKGQYFRVLDYSGIPDGTGNHIPDTDSNYVIDNLPIITFSSSMNEITYKIKITNYSQFKINTEQILKSAESLARPTGPLVITNTTPLNISQKTLNEESTTATDVIYDTFEYTSTITCIKFTKSFQYNHEINISLTKVVSG